MPAGIKANSDGSAAIQVGGTDVITLTSGGAATFVTSPTTVQAGTAAAPSITFSGDTNTGIYSPGADTIAFTEGGVESMRIDSAGNIGVGTTSPGGNSSNRQLSLVGSSTSQITMTGSGSFSANIGTNGTFTYLESTSTAPLVFFTNGSERARITSAGGFKQQSAGASYEDTALGYSEFNNGEAGTAALLQRCTNASFAGSVSAIKATRAASTAFDLILSQANAVTQFRVRGDGTIYAINTTVQSASDERMKENIRDSEDGLDVITALRPVRFDYKEGFGNDRKNQLGFIAQEIEQVFPYAVDVWGESDDPDNPYKSVGAAALIPVFVKAIQEQQAMIDELKAKVAALEGA